MHVSKINNNPITNAYKKRISNLPESKKQKLKELSDMLIPEYQLKVIKRKRKYPEIGDVFEIKPNDETTYHGVVLNNHINNIDGDDLILIVILNNDEDVRQKLSRKIKRQDLFIPPCIVGKEYWTRGYFYNIDHFEGKIKIEKFRFYSIKDGFFYDENDKKKSWIKPKIISIGGVYTISGIAYDMHAEMIMRGV